MVFTSTVPSVAWAMTSQIEPRSAPRSELKVQKTFHSAGPLRYAGRSASTQATTAAAVATTNGRHCRRRAQMTSRPPSRNNG